MFEQCLLTSTVTSEQATATSPPAYTLLSVSWAWYFYLRHIRAWALLMAAPLVILGVTSVCEVLLQQASAQAMSVILMEYAIGAARWLAFSMGLAAVTWYTAAAICEDAPSVSEAWERGWHAAWRVGMAVLPLWVVLLVYAAFGGMVCRAVLELFRSLGIFARAAAVVTVLLLFAPLAVLLMARYLFVVPVAILTRDLRSFATARAAALMSWRGVWLTWPYTLSMATLLGLGVLGPSLAYVGSVWELMNETYVSERAIIIRHVLAVGLLLTTGTFGVCGCTLLYCAFYAPWRLKAEGTGNVADAAESE